MSRWGVTFSHAPVPWTGRIRLLLILGPGGGVWAWCLPTLGRHPGVGAHPGGPKMAHMPGEIFWTVLIQTMNFFPAGGPKKSGFLDTPCIKQTSHWIAGEEELYSQRSVSMAQQYPLRVISLSLQAHISVLCLSLRTGTFFISTVMETRFFRWETRTSCPGGP